MPLGSGTRFLGIPTGIALFSLLLMSSTCERPVELDLPLPEPKLVIVSNFTNGEELHVRVSKSRSVLDDSPEEYIGDATVELFVDDIFLESLTLVTPQAPRESPYYKTQQTSIQVGVVYNIKVTAPGFEPVMAQSSIPPRVNLRDFTISDLQIHEGGQPGSLIYSYRVGVSFDDPIKQVNYYHLNFYQQVQDCLFVGGDTLILRNYLQPVVFSNNNSNNYLQAYFGGGVLIQDTPFDGQTISLNFPMSVEIFPENQKLGKIYAELRAVSEDYYLFHNSLSRQQNAGNGGTPSEPIFIYNNIENGHGIFAGYSQTLDSLMVNQ